jgi:D-xylose transport system permease protein
VRFGADLDRDTAAEADAAGVEAALAAAPEVLANSLGDYARVWWRRVRGGDSGALPVLGGLIAIVLFFQLRNSLFLSAGNLVNLLVQGSTYVLLGMAEVFVLLLGEIDLSIGWVAAIGAVITAWLVSPPNPYPWWLAILAGLAATAAIGALQGTLITRLGLPSFVVTLGGLLGWQGMVIFLVGHSGVGSGGTIGISNNVINDLANGNLTSVVGWILMAVIVGLVGLFMIFRDSRRRASNLVAPPASVTLLKVAVMAVAGVALLLVCNTNRGVTVTVQGVPIVVLIVLGVLAAWTVLLGRTRFGRYIYAIGGNAEAARRAGVSLTWIRTLAFTLCGLTAGAAGVVYASRLGSISTNVEGGSLVLYAVASAVIGGTSLFGGRGKMLHALLGGLIVAAIYNGLGLLGMGAAAQYMVTALVLLAAVTVDTVARRGRTST